MAEMIWWCEVHGYQSFDGVDGSSCEDGVWLEDRGGWNCRKVVRILSVPGELIDPAKVDYEAGIDAAWDCGYSIDDVTAKRIVAAALGVGSQ